MYAFERISDGEILGVGCYHTMEEDGRQIYTPVAEDSARKWAGKQYGVAGDAVNLHLLTEAQADEYRQGGKAAALVDGAVVIEDAPAAPILYLLVEISGAPRSVMGSDGTMPALAPGESFSVSVGLHTADDPAAPLVPTGATPITWPITVRDSTGNEFDVVPVDMVDGAASFTYSAPAGDKSGRVTLEDSDLGPVPLGGVSYEIRLMQAVVFYVVRADGVSAAA